MNLSYSPDNDGLLCTTDRNELFTVQYSPFRFTYKGKIDPKQFVGGKPYRNPSQVTCVIIQNCIKKHRQGNINQPK